MSEAFDQPYKPPLGNEQPIPEGDLAMPTEMTKDLKVRLPVHHHMKLQTLKILKGKNMGDTLCEALDMYFAERGIQLASVPTDAVPEETA